MKASIIGDGGWGTALGVVLKKNGHEVTIWGPFPDYIKEIQAAGENRKFLPGVKIPPSIKWTADRGEAVHHAEVVVLASPSKFMQSVAESFKGIIPATAAVTSVAKGLHPQTHHRMTEVASEVLGLHVAALSGPSHAEEVARGIPTAIVIASRHASDAERLQQAFNNPAFRVYTSDDVIGVELGGALKNVIAIAAGVSDGIGYGDNTKAALITRGLAEMTRIGVALGAKTSTFAGLSGVGDLITTCVSKLSRNRGVGERLGKGETTEQILASMVQVAEGVWTCGSARDLAKEKGIEAPITEQVCAVIHDGKNPRQAVTDLMARDPKPERG